MQAPLNPFPLGRLSPRTPSGHMGSGGGGAGGVCTLQVGRPRGKPLGALSPYPPNNGRAQRSETNCTPARASWWGAGTGTCRAEWAGLPQARGAPGACQESELTSRVTFLSTRTAPARKPGVAGTPLPKSHHPSVRVG